MLRTRGDMPTGSQQQRDRVFNSIRFTATGLTIIGWLAMTLPSAAITASYRNDFRSCVGRLQSMEIDAESAATACAGALEPRELSKCVSEIKAETAIAAVDALATCRQVRRANELANCVVGISRINQEQPVPGILNYCGRSLLPERFAECVVGLRVETNIAPTEAMDTCIDASDLLGDVSPNFVPGNQTPLVAPEGDVSPNSVPGNQTPLVAPEGG